MYREIQDSIQKNLDHTFTYCDQISQHFDASQRENNSINFFCLCIIDRLRSSSLGLKSLVENVVDRQELEFSCGLIVRAIILDYMSVIYALQLMNDGWIIEAKPPATALNAPQPGQKSKDLLSLEKFCDIMLADSPSYMVEDVHNSGGRYTSAESGLLYSNIVKRFPSAFEPYLHDGTKPVRKYKERFTAGKLYQLIYSSPITRGTASIFEAYSIYSKYDHFGEVYYGTSRRPFMQKMMHLDQSIRAFPRSLLFTSTILWILQQDNQVLALAMNDTKVLIDSFT